MKSDINRLRIDHEVAKLHADLAVASPQSYSLEEKRVISEEIDLVGDQIERVIKEDFKQLPLSLQTTLLKTLNSFEQFPDGYWNELLC